MSSFICSPTTIPAWTLPLNKLSEALTFDCRLEVLSVSLSHLSKVDGKVLPFQLSTLWGKMCFKNSKVTLSDENLSHSTRKLEVTKWYIRRKHEWHQLNMLLAILNRFPDLTTISQKDLANCNLFCKCYHYLFGRAVTGQLFRYDRRDFKNISKMWSSLNKNRYFWKLHANIWGIAK